MPGYAGVSQYRGILNTDWVSSSLGQIITSIAQTQLGVTHSHHRHTSHLDVVTSRFVAIIINDDIILLLTSIYVNKWQSLFSFDVNKTIA